MSILKAAIVAPSKDHEIFNLRKIEEVSQLVTIRSKGYYIYTKYMTCGITVTLFVFIILLPILPATAGSKRQRRSQRHDHTDGRLQCQDRNRQHWLRGHHGNTRTGTDE